MGTNNIYQYCQRHALSNSPYEGDKYKIYRCSFMGRITPRKRGQNKLTAVNLVEVALVVHAAASKTCVGVPIVSAVH